jgi:TonB-dependent starch-binding outer membrane protein SusC
MTKFYLFRYVIVLLVLITTTAWSQSKTVTGKVTAAEDGAGVPGVNVLEKGTSNGTVSDADGNYSITVSENSTLVFSFVGYQTQEMPVGTRATIDVSMQSDVTSLSEVVVIGYGEVRKTDLTGSVEVVNGEKFNKGFQTSPEQLIQGRVSGVQITQSSGAPGAATNIRIRGASSIRAGNGPLIVLDGVPLDGRDISAGADVGAGRASAKNPLAFLNPNDIESMNILKDASATAIYGSRGANGVVIIQTKKGNQNRPTLSYASSVGLSTVPEGRKYNLLNASQFIEQVPNSTLHYGSSVDAFDEILQTGVIQDHNLSFAGGTQDGSYRLSFGLQDQEGVIKNTGLKKYSGAFNINQKALNGRVTLQSSIIASLMDDENTALADNVGAEGDIMISALRWNPSRSFYDNNGALIQPSDNERNPLAFLKYYDDNTTTNRVFANFGATVKIIEGLNYKLNFGLDRAFSERRVAVSRRLNANFVANSGIGNIEVIRAGSDVIEHTLNYAKDVSTSTNLNVLAGYSYQQFNRRASNQRGTNFVEDNQALYLSNLDYASGFPANQNWSNESPKDELQSFFGRVNVTFNEKLNVTATIRADGSSRFGDENKYGYFPSAAVAYTLSDEGFVPESFSALKVRLSYGITGNQEFPSGSAQDQYRPNNVGSGVTLTNVGNPALKWETTAQMNFGIDFGFINDKLTGSIDLYQKKTSDLLFRTRVAAQGPDTFVWRNLEDVEVLNRGVDINLDAYLIEKTDFAFNVGVNLSLFDNEIRNVSKIFPDGIITGEINGQGLSGQRGQLLYDNQDLYAFYLPVFTGYNESGASTFADLNGDGENTASGIVGPGKGDRTFVGSPNPDMVLGFRANARYKNFDASLYMNGAFGHQVFDNTALALFSRAALNGGANVDDRVLSTTQSGSDSPVPSTQFLEDADFFRLTNLTLGYNLPRRSDNSIIQSVRLFVTGQNLFVITKYNGFDPEVNINKSIDDVPSFGIDYAAYPRPRIFTLGLNVVF